MNIRKHIIKLIDGDPIEWAGVIIFGIVVVGVVVGLVVMI